MPNTTIHLIGPSQRAFAHQCIDDAAPGDVVKIGKPTRRDAQNKLLWALIADLQRQVPAMRAYSADDIKLRFLQALGTEMRFLPKLEGEGLFPVGLRSSTLSVAQFSALCELIFKYGAEHGVVFRDDETAALGCDIAKLAMGGQP